jgi:hypothetical protein
MKVMFMKSLYIVALLKLAHIRVQGSHVFISCRHFVTEVKTAHFSLMAALRSPLLNALTLINLIGEVLLPKYLEFVTCCHWYFLYEGCPLVGQNTPVEDYLTMMKQMT